MIEIKNLCKSFDDHVIFDGFSLKINTGDFILITGNSGCGKTTLLNMIGGLDRPSAGTLFVDGKNLFTMSEKELVEYKQKTVGFVWQNNGRNMLPYLSALENIMLPMQISGTSKKRERALALLEMVGLPNRKNSRMNMLSGGEQQRIAIAIALANSPKLLLADEPTGSVDRKTADYIFDLFSDLNKNGQTILIVTHDMELSKKVNRVVAIRDGKISSERVLKEQYADRVRESGVSFLTEETQDEYVVLDRAGRLQIPEKLLQDLALKDNKVKVCARGNEIIVSRPD